MKATLDKAAIRIAYAASIDLDARLVLSHVKIGEEKIVACNGYMLAERKIETEPKSGEVMLVDSAIILKTHKILGGKQLIIESKEDGVAIISNEEVDSPLISTQLLQATFPPYEQVIPTKEGKAYVALSSFFLTTLLKVADLESSLAIKMKVREPTDLVEIHSGETTVYMMPYYLPEEE